MGGAKYSVLVVDDEPEVVNSTVTYLSRVAQKYRDTLQIFQANSVSEAQRLIVERPVDVIFADYHFPGGMSGDEFIDLIDDPFGKKLIIMMSAWDEKVLGGIITKRHKNLGSSFKFLRKPFDELEIQAKYLEIEQFFSAQALPLPLAYAKQSYAASLAGPERILAIKDIIESLSKYCVAVMMSDLLRMGELGKLRLTFKLHSDLTLGAWLQWLECALGLYEQNVGHALMPELVEMFGEGAQEESGFLRMMYEFKQYRDVGFAHGYKREDAHYTSVADAYEGKLLRLLERLRFTARYTMFTPERFDFTGELSTDYRFDVRVLMGSERVPAQTSLVSPMRLQREQVYCHVPSGECLPLSPYITYQMCESCGSQRLFMLDGIRPTLLTYKTFCNHSRTDMKPAAEFNRLLGSLRPTS